jgi:hypothetical protein
MLYFKPVEENGENIKIIALDGDRELGSCFVRIEAYKCFLSGITADENDALLVEGLIRSALNYAANRGAYIATCLDDSIKNVLEYLGFENKDGEYRGEIPELLKGNCCKSS